MALKIVCSGYLIRHPVGGHTWHHLQYLVGLKRLGHDVTFLEDFGWPSSCFDPKRGTVDDDPTYGIRYMSPLFEAHGLAKSWCYLAADGVAHGMPREQLAQRCREADLYLALSNISWVPEAALCRRRATVDTDPVFTQIGALGVRGDYHVRFTFGENVHKPGSTMPTADTTWLPTRQPVVLDLWKSDVGDAGAPLTTVMNWASFAEHTYRGQTYGLKSREFVPYFTLPRDTGEPMEIAVNGPPEVLEKMRDGGWSTADVNAVSRSPFTYQDFLRRSRGEFCVAKHGYVVTNCGWFSDRTTGYMATGRPAVVQDTGFSEFLPCGKGLIPFRTREEALAGVRALRDDYASHCRAARRIIEEHFDARKVLTDLLERCL